LREDEHFYTGKVGGAFAQALPAAVVVTPDLMERGRRRFDVYCSVCHGVSGRGDGMIARRADRIPDKTNWVPPTNLHTDPVRAQPVGQLFDTITHGVRNMPAYGPQIPEADRWAIILYLKALQRSRRATLEDVPADARATPN
ncbi:MAG: cytochrome c, partial [Candidatus Methylomirabilis sp.]|nr:cytochrome c [Deltaproteobacteria bacterium]